ncbi:MAG: hypothetical protein LBJ37_22675 [Paucimonas sp.]|jgi:hypothetical protein|nr:hypothetical protein [Paucimonas sp.]
MTDSTPTTPLDDRLALDRFIAANAPAWLKDASLEEIDALRDSLLAHQRSQARVGALLATLQAPDAFALPRLIEGLDRLGCGETQVRRARWREVRLRVEFPVFRVTDVDLPRFQHYPVDSDLLSRLLRNFSADEADAGYYYPGSGILSDGALLGCAAYRVAALCRELDLGGHYQAHLDQVLTPADASQRQAVLDLLREDKRVALVAHARCARLKGEIDAPALQLLLDFAKGELAINEINSHVRCSTLQLLGFNVPGALLLEVSAEAADATERWYQPPLARQLLLYLANDPDRPLRQCGSWTELNDALVTDLRSDRHTDFFTRQLARDDRLSFLGKLQACMRAARPQLDAKGPATVAGPFEQLAGEQLQRIKDDAAALLVPTADVDRAVHRRRMQALESAGLNVAGVLASFIPGVGELMLIGLVKDVLSEVYEGVVDWSHGHTEEALEHLFGVVGNLAVGALVAGGTAVVLRQLRRSAFVDGLLPIVRGDGSRRLCSLDRLDGPAPLALPARADADGLLRLQGRHWWRSAGQVVEVREDAVSGRWRMVNPSRPEAWAPELSGNGDGAWWHVGEHPLRWQGIAYLLERLGPRAEGLSVLAREQVAQICGYDEARLRGLLVDRRETPAVLAQVLEDFAREAGDPVPSESAPGPLGLRLLGLFPGLPARVVEALVRDVDAAVASRPRLPLALLERAREALREMRVVRALEGLYLDAYCRGDTVRLVFSLFRRLPRWPRGLSFELRDETADGPVLERLLPAGEAGEVRRLVGDQGRYTAFDAQGRALGQPASLFQALADGLGREYLASLGHGSADPATALCTQLREQAGGDRQQLPGLLGMTARRRFFQPPQRFADGRLGYPLSGRGSAGRSSLTSLVRRLYPGWSDLEASVWLDELQQRQGDPMGELLRLEVSFRNLDAVLARWQLETSVIGRPARRRVAEEIRRCWRRQTATVSDVDGRVIGYRLSLGRSLVGDLPELPATVDFSHVLDLDLSGTGQWRRVNGFLERFPSLRWLDLGQNGCSELPTALDDMSALEELYLDGNDIHLSLAGQATLSRLTRLEVLNLDRNPLGRAPDLGRMPRLRRLSLRGTGIQTLPEGLLSRPFLALADLRGNQLTNLPEAFFAAPARIRSATVLFGNPLRPEVRERLWEAGEEDGLSVPGQEGDGVREQWLAGAREDLLRERDEQWQALRAEADAQGFFDLLGNLLETAEYRLVPAHLQERVWQMIGAAVDDTALRESLFALANAPTTCIDSVSSSFSVLDVRLQVALVRGRVPGTDHGAALLAFARRLFRLDRLERHVRQVIQQRHLRGELVDEVEISLAYRTRLADALELPGQPRHMQFGSIAEVTEGDLGTAQRAVETAEAGPELADFSARQDFWIEYLREGHGADFRAVEARFWERLEQLCETQAQIPEGEYLQRMNQLGAERESALHALARSLTEAALERGSEA